MGQPILSESTVEALRECVLLAEERHGFSLVEALRDAGLLQDQLRDPYMARITFDGILKAVNWNDRESILPLVPIFEEAYAESPKDFHSVHKKIDVSLAKDGFRIKEGQLIRLPF